MFNFTNNLYKSIFLLFIAYGIIGYFLEVITTSLEQKKINLTRGFLVGPIVPIYGVGSLLITLFLSTYRNDLVVLFVMSLVLCSVVEFTTSYIMEKAFKLRWWDYSHMKYNLDGRICLLNAVLFGIGGVLVVKYVNNILFIIINSMTSIVFNILFYILLIIFITDLVVTLIVMNKLKINTAKYLNKDATNKIRQEVRKQLENSSFLVKRLLNSFPKLDKINIEFSKIKDIIFPNKISLTERIITLFNRKK